MEVLYVAFWHKFTLVGVMFKQMNRKWDADNALCLTHYKLKGKGKEMSYRKLY